MLKYNSIKVSISYRNVTHYLKLGYEAIIGVDLEIKTEHLPSSSHVKVDVICEICKSENSIIYHKYIENKKRHGFYGCKSCSRQKAALTSLEKYGVDNFSKTDEWKKKVEKTNIERFGYKTNLLNPDYQDLIKKRLIEKYGTDEHWKIRSKKNKMIINDLSKIKGQEIKFSESLYNDYFIVQKYHTYRNECRKLTKRVLNKLIDNWDGFDYYDNEYIIENFNLDHNNPKYPTVDHKISVYFGFINNISPEKIADISNLCMTKRSINSKKRDSIEENFKII